MGCNLSKMQLPRLNMKKRATKAKAWSEEETEIRSSPTCEHKKLPQITTAQTSYAQPTSHEDFSLLAFMAGKVPDHDWVYVSQREQSKPRARTLAARGRSKIPFASGFGEHFSPLIFMTENLSEWVDPYDRELLTKNLKECLGYQGLNANGFHLLTLSPRPFLEMRTNYQLPLYVVSMVRVSVLEHFLRYIPGAIQSKVNDTPFVLVIRDICNQSGRSSSCSVLVLRILQRLQRRFRGQLTKIVIYCAAGELHKYLFKTRSQLHPSRRATRTFEQKLVFANQFTPRKLRHATGFRGVPAA